MECLTQKNKPLYKISLTLGSMELCLHKILGECWLSLTSGFHKLRIPFSFVPSFNLPIPSRSHHQTHTVAFPAFKAISRWVTPVAWQWRIEREVLSSFNGAWQGWKHRREVENLETPLRRWFFPVILELRVAVLWSRKVSEIVEIRSVASQGWIWLALSVSGELNRPLVAFCATLEEVGVARFILLIL